MPLDPEFEALLGAMAATPSVPLDDATVGDLRASFGMLVQMTAGDAPEMAAVTDHLAPSPHGDVPVRVYRPRAVDGLPLVVFLHGGGWTIGSVADYDPIVRQIAARADAVVVSVDYRLAPEHPFPAPYDDAWAGLQWAVANAPSIGADPARVALWGDSAGGNLSAAVALRARDEGGPALVLQVLVYPVTDAAMDTVSYRDNGEGYFLERATMRYFWDAYTRNGTDGSDPRLSPLRADLHDLPPAVVITAEFDPLRDEGEAYAAALAAAGVSVEQRRFDGAIHGFAMMPGLSTSALDAFDLAVTAAQRAFGTPPGTV